MAAFTLNHATQLDRLTLLTKEDLVDAINAVRPVYRVKKSMSKYELISVATDTVAQLKDEHALEVAHEKQKHDAQLAKDLEHPRFVRALQSLALSMRNITAHAKKAKEEAVAKIAEDVRGQLSWKFESLAYNAELENDSTRLGDYLTCLATEDTRTIAEAKGELVALRDSYMDRVLSYSFSSSTNAASNLIDVQAFEVTRKMAKVMKKAVEAFEHDLANDNADAHYRCEMISWGY